jgi:hypothetical protein
LFAFARWLHCSAAPLLGSQLDGCSLAADAERAVKRKQLQLGRGILPAPQWFPGALRAERAKAASESDDERWLLALAANVCVFAGIRRRSFTGLLLIIGGSMLAWWADAGVVRSQSL